jgi:hypothetical protein
MFYYYFLLLIGKHLILILHLMHLSWVSTGLIPTLNSNFYQVQEALLKMIALSQTISDGNKQITILTEFHLPMNKQATYRMRLPITGWGTNNENINIDDRK